MQLNGIYGNDTLTSVKSVDCFVVDGDTDTITDPGTGPADIPVITGGTANATLQGGWTAPVGSSNVSTAVLNSAGFTVNLASVTGTGGWTVNKTGAAAAFTGSASSDTLTGGTGNDTLTGGDGSATTCWTARPSARRPRRNAQSIAEDDVALMKFLTHSFAAIAR